MNRPIEELTLIGDELKTCLAVVSETEFERVAGIIARAEGRIFLAGAGRSGFAMRAFAMRLVHLGKRVHFIGEATMPAISERDLFIIGSGSGRTVSLLAMATNARRIGAAVILFTINPASPIGRLADFTLRIPAAASEKGDPFPDEPGSAQPMGSMFEQALWIAGDGLVMRLMRMANLNSAQLFANHANLE